MTLQAGRGAHEAVAGDARVAQAREQGLAVRARAQERRALVDHGVRVQLGARHLPFSGRPHYASPRSHWRTACPLRVPHATPSYHATHTHHLSTLYLLVFFYNGVALFKNFGDFKYC